MSDILCVTSRLLCRDDFLSRIQKIAQARPAGIILREKDLPKEEYAALAKAIMDICKAYGVPCILHSFFSVALDLGCSALHLPLSLARTLSPAQRSRFEILGVSCHCAEEALEAQALGCTYVTAGHIFHTACKEGVPGRGLPFLQDVCRSVSIPVYAIGGISASNIAQVRLSGARGACVMSGAMVCQDVKAYFQSLKQA